MKILLVHLLNNYTGSPKVLSTVINLLTEKSDIKISLLTSKTDGFLSDLKNVQYHYNGYFWTDNRFLLALVFAFAQIKMFFLVLFGEYDVVYINTTLPFAAAFAAKIKKIKVIYHVHEIYMTPGFVKRLYYRIMNKCANSIICVSHYVQEHLPFGKERSCVIYNPIISTNDVSDNNNYLRKKFDDKIIFMPCSLKDYKGVNQFVELANQNSDFTFWLLCSTSLANINEYFSKIPIPKNLTFFEKRKKLSDLYHQSAIVTNLSLPDKCIETFGLTLIEGFDTYTPAIAPNCGGPKEIIENGKNGFLINPYDLNEVSNAIHLIMNDFETYCQFSAYAKQTIEKFDINLFKEKLYSKIGII